MSSLIAEINPYPKYIALGIFALFALFALIACVFLVQYFNPWIQGKVIGSDVGIFDRLDHLVGQSGRSLTPLQPVGAAEFAGLRVLALSEEGSIPAGTPVRAVGVRRARLVVRADPGSSLDGVLPPV